MKHFVIIVAAGRGRRMNDDMPKQFLLLGNKPLLMHTIHNIYHFDKTQNIILVLHKDYLCLWNNLCKLYNFDVPLTIVEGGQERFYSVKNGLEIVEDNSLVAIHDGVRPFVSRSVWESCFDIAKHKGNAIPAIIPKDSIRIRIKIKKEENTRPISRSNTYLIQTPQCFHSSIIKEAYQQQYKEDYTDDIQVLEALNTTKVNIVEGNSKNIKITDPLDMLIAEQILQQGQVVN